MPVLLKQPQINSPAFLYWEFYEGGFKQALRKGNWKAIRFYKNAQPAFTELYNLSSDVGEKNDMAKMHPEKIRELEALMDKAHKPSESSLFQVK